jgi:hypothetical protein
MDLFDHAKNVIEYLARGVEFAAALIIGIAAVEATMLAVGLEFELAADIRRTAITPTWEGYRATGRNRGFANRAE